MNKHIPQEHLLHNIVDDDIDGAIQNEEPITFANTKRQIELGANEIAIDSEGRTARDIAAAYGAHVLQLYDSVSRVDWSKELTLEEFAGQCCSILSLSGFNSFMVDQNQISVSIMSSPERVIILVGQWYGWRHDPYFADRLINTVRQKLR